MSCESVINEQNNSYCCLSGYEGNERHVCLRSFTTALYKAGRGISVVAPLTLGMIHTGAEQQGRGLCVVVVVSVSGKEEGNNDWCLHLV